MCFIPIPKHNKSLVRAPRALLAEELLSGGRSRALVPISQSRRQSSALEKAVEYGMNLAGQELMGVSPSDLVRAGKMAYSAGRELFSPRPSSAAAKSSRSVAPTSAVRAAMVPRSLARDAGVTTTVGNSIIARSGLGTPAHIQQFNHPVAGPAIRMSGTCVVCPITAVAGSTACLATNLFFKLQPRAVGAGTQLGALSDFYQNYRFRKVVLRYIPNCPTTTLGGFRIAYVPDGSYTALDAPTYLTIGQCPFNFACAAWEPQTMSITNMPCAYDMLYQYDASGTTQALRSCVQGNFVGIWNSARLEAVETTLGVLEMDYEIDLLNAGPSLAGLPAFNTVLGDLRSAELARDEKLIREHQSRLLSLSNSRVGLPVGPTKPAREEKEWVRV